MKNSPVFLAQAEPKSASAPGDAKARLQAKAPAIARQAWRAHAVYHDNDALIRRADSDATLVAVLVLEFEDFAALRRHLGKIATDTLLDRMSELLFGLMGDNSLAVLLDRDRFMIIAGGLASPIEAHHLACDIQELIAAVPAQDVALFPIVGVSFYPEQSLNLDALVDMAQRLSGPRRCARFHS